MECMEAGGGSGGGSINIFYNNRDCEILKPKVDGGTAGKQGSHGMSYDNYPTAGKSGSISIGRIVNGTYVSEM